MLFFKFHIGDWESGTKLLTPTEKGVYLDLLLLYYSKEEPILRSYCERITKGYTDEERKAFDYVVSEFFTEADGRLYHSRCEEEINASREKSQKARQSVMARYKKATNEERTYNERSTDDLLTNNHKPITNNQDKKTNKKKISSLVKPDDVSQDIFDEWIDFKKSVSRAKPSQRMIDAIVREAQTAEITTEKAMVLQMENGWQGFKAEYVKKDSGNLFDQQKEVTADTITESQVSFFANKLAYFNPMSKFSRSGESYQQFEKRLATNLRIPENFEKYKPYLVQLGLLKT